MKIIIFFSLLLFSHFNFAQVKDIATDKGSADRTIILNILRIKVKPQIKQDITFVVSSLQVKDNYAFFKGNVRDITGRQIDFRKTVFKERVEAGIFEGDPTFALFKKINGKWKYLIHVVGPTDVAYACWWKEYKAPKQIFDLNYDCSN